MGLIVPPAIPTVTAEGDTSNYDYYPEDDGEEMHHLTHPQLKEFEIFNRVVSGKNHQ